jgi:hypothetical protein
LVTRAPAAFAARSTPRLCSQLARRSRTTLCSRGTCSSSSSSRAAAVARRGRSGGQGARTRRLRRSDAQLAAPAHCPPRARQAYRLHIVCKHVQPAARHQLHALVVALRQGQRGKWQALAVNTHGHVQRPWEQGRICWANQCTGHRHYISHETGAQNTAQNRASATSHQPTRRPPTKHPPTWKSGTTTAKQSTSC